MPELNAKQRVFCQEYIIDLNATQAAIRAGYSKRTAKNQASLLLTKSNVDQYVQELLANRAAKSAITAERVLEEIQGVINNCNDPKSDLFNPQAVLKGTEQLGRHLVMFSDRVVNKAEHSDEDIDRRLKELEAKASDSTVVVPLKAANS